MKPTKSTHAPGIGASLMIQGSLKKRTDLHLARKVWHILGVLLIAYGFNRVSRPEALQIITFATVFIVIIDLLRQQIPILNKGLVRFFQPVMRESERQSLAGVSYLLLGCLIVFYLFPAEVVTLALLFLAIGDPLASYVGIRFGTDRIMDNKSLQGFLAAFVACAAVAALYYLNRNLMTDRLLLVSLLSGLAGGLAELIPVGRLDDNLTFPVLSCAALWLLFYMFGGFF